MPAPVSTTRPSCDHHGPHATQRRPGSRSESGLSVLPSGGARAPITFRAMSDLGFPPAPQQRPPTGRPPESKVPVWANPPGRRADPGRRRLPGAQPGGEQQAPGPDVPRTPGTRGSCRTRRSRRSSEGCSSSTRSRCASWRPRSSRRRSPPTSQGARQGGPRGDRPGDWAAPGLRSDQGRRRPVRRRSTTPVAAGTLAYYSFEDKNITVRGQRVTPAMRSTLVHELTHVLQDQNFGIGAMQKKLEKSKDDGEHRAGRRCSTPSSRATRSASRPATGSRSAPSSARPSTRTQAERVRRGRQDLQEDPEDRHHDDDLAVHPG